MRGYFHKTNNIAVPNEFSPMTRSDMKYPSGHPSLGFQCCDDVMKQGQGRFLPCCLRMAVEAQEYE